jgi:DNA polymerase-3 subunit delta'
MARAPKAPKADASDTPSPLPLPEPLLAHHRQALGPLMRQWRDQDRVPPVLLLTGPAGIGKRAVAHWLSQWLLCERAGFADATRAEEDEGDGLFGGSLFGEAPGTASAAATAGGEPGPCGECPSCQRALRGNWVDFTEIAVDDEDAEKASGGSLKIEQFRELKARLGFSAFDGPFRIVLIRDAERMTVQAANSLLKILEEPPPRWVFLLTSGDASLLLPTLVSRCQSVRLRPLGEPTLERLLSEAGAPADRRSVCARLAQGSWSRAQACAEDEAWERRREIYRFVENPARELGALLDWAAAEPAHFDFLLTHLELAASDLVRWAVDETPPVGTLEDRRLLKDAAAETVRRLGSRERARAFWTKRLEQLFRARALAQAPLNRKIVIQDLLSPWLEPA